MTDSKPMVLNPYTPSHSMGLGGIAGAATVILVWIAGMFKLQVPPEVASAITVLITGGVAYVTQGGRQIHIYPNGRPAELPAEEVK